MRIVVTALLVGSTLSSVAVAQTPPAPPPAAPADEAMVAAARELNRHGIKLLDAGDTERALEYFLRSRAMQPNTKNTANAAICLEKMGRYDEALELFEELLVKYASGLDEEDRKNVAPAMQALRQKVGSLALSSNVAGAVTIDGRPRGKLPLAVPIRVVPGEHLVRVSLAGYAAFEKRVAIRVGETLSLDAKLEALRGVGQLVLEDASSPGAEVFVDRVRVGTAPWEGSLAPGKHVVWTRKGDVGSAPTAVTVLEGQAALARVESKPLGAGVLVRVEPRTAKIEIDGVSLGNGSWEGRLPPGSYAITASEEGFRTRTSRLEAPPAGAPRQVTLSLEVDPTHPRWPSRAVGRPWVDAFAGYVGGATVGSGAEEGCPESCATDPTVAGSIVGLRGGYRFPFGLSLELGGGYMALETSFQRGAQDSSGPGQMVTVSYTLHDDLAIRGPFAALGVSQRLNVGSRAHLTGRAGVGLLFAQSTDPVVGRAATTGASVPVVLEDRNQTLSSAAVFVHPELAAGMRLGPLDVGFSLGVGIFVTDGPSFTRGRFGPRPVEGDPDPGSVGNAQESDVIAEERAYGRFLVWMPQLSLGRTF